VFVCTCNTHYFCVTLYAVLSSFFLPLKLKRSFLFSSTLRICLSFSPFLIMIPFEEHRPSWAWSYFEIFKIRCWKFLVAQFTLLHKNRVKFSAIWNWGTSVCPSVAVGWISCIRQSQHHDISPIPLIYWSLHGCNFQRGLTVLVSFSHFAVSHHSPMFISVLNQHQFCYVQRTVRREIK